MRYYDREDPFQVEVSINVPIDSEFSISERHLDVMVAQGVDVKDEWDVLDFYRKNFGKTIDGVYFVSLSDLSDDWSTRYDEQIEIVDSNISGEAPERFWPPEEPNAGLYSDEPEELEDGVHGGDVE